MKKALTGISLAAGLLLGGCGGGGDSTAVSTPEGIWGGDTASGSATALIVLETGETWGLYANEAAPSAGILYGNLSSSGSQVTGSVLDVNLLGTGTSTVSLAGTYEPLKWLNLSLNAGADTLNTLYDASYDVPVTLSQVAGTYTGVALGNGNEDDTAVVQVTAIGQISTSSTTFPQCTGWGSVALRGTSKAVLNFTITFSGDGCLFPAGTTVFGVAQYDSGAAALIALGLTPAKTSGLMLLATRAPV